ncbi:hypothetical protein F5883DRAFT_654211 [Diaporthe sp. PMI_573]|nr:hypothetical protein F5883DRAFT_654211 [Diaporthaceae sp. PMI_573]
MPFFPQFLPVFSVWHRTQVWKFVRRDGQYGYGTEPLSFFDDWDSTVDTAIPYPKSDALDVWANYTKHRLCRDCHRSRAKCVKALLGDILDLFWNISPPEDAAEFAKWEKKTTFPIEHKAVANAAAPANFFEHIPLSIRLSSSSLGSSSVGTPGVGGRPAKSSDLHPRWKWGAFFPQNKTYRPWESQFNSRLTWGRECLTIYYWRTAPFRSDNSPKKRYRSHC